MPLYIPAMVMAVCIFGRYGYVLICPYWRTFGYECVSMCGYRVSILLVLYRYERELRGILGFGLSLMSLVSI